MNFQIDYSRLKNGVRVLAIPMKSVESVTAMVLVRTGSRNEVAGQEGISHVLEHMLFKGTKSYPTAMKLAETIDGVGAMNNAFTGKEYTGYYITSAAKHLPLSLDILSEMVTLPLLPQADLLREQGVIIEEINMYEDQPMEKASEEWENLIYAGSAMGRSIIGTKETVSATTSASLRAYLDEWYRGGNVLVVVVGKIGTSNKYQYQDLVEEKFGGVEPGEESSFATALGYGPVEDRHFYKKTEQAHFYLGVPALSMQDPNRYALQLANVILGGGMSSRLFNEIREKRGLAYYVRSIFDTSWDGGYLAVRAGVRLDKLSEAMKIVREEMLKLGETMTEAELTKAKEYILGHLPLTLEDTMGVAQFMGMRALLTGEVKQPKELEQKIAGVTMAEVRAVWRELVGEGKIRSVVVGPKAS